MADLLERLEHGSVICAEGYLFELERRGYLQAGGFVPEVVLENPDKVAELHREFVHAGSDVVEAFTYYAHREKLRLIGKEYLLEDVPNVAWCLGYVNASWTLRADMTARAVAKLLAYMDSHGYTHAYPHLGDVPMPEKPAWDLQAGYVLARDPEAITLSEIVSAVDGPIVAGDFERTSTRSPR